MNFIFFGGTQEVAPICIVDAGIVPIWNRKTHSELTRQETADLLTFCMTEGEQIGYEDYRRGRPARTNPFHCRFMHGMPYLHFKSFYEIGWQKAKDENAQIAEQLPLLAA